MTERPERLSGERPDTVSCDTAALAAMLRVSVPVKGMRGLENTTPGGGFTREQLDDIAARAAPIDAARAAAAEYIAEERTMGNDCIL